MEFLADKNTRVIIVVMFFVAVILGAIITRWWRTPKIYPPGNTLGDASSKDVFRCDNVKDGHSYIIWHELTSQEFVVIHRGPSDWFYIGVYPPGDRRLGRKKRFAFKGWVRALAGSHFIEQSHVANSPMGSASHDQYLKALEANQVG